MTKSLTVCLSPAQQAHHQNKHVCFFSPHHCVSVTCMSLSDSARLRLQVQVCTVSCRYKYTQTDRRCWPMFQTGNTSLHFEADEGYDNHSWKGYSDNTNHSSTVISMHVVDNHKKRILLRCWKAGRRYTTYRVVTADDSTITGNPLLLSIFHTGIIR